MSKCFLLNNCYLIERTILMSLDDKITELILFDSFTQYPNRDILLRFNIASDMTFLITRNNRKISCGMYQIVTFFFNIKHTYFFCVHFLKFMSVRSSYTPTIPLCYRNSCHGFIITVNVKKLFLINRIKKSCFLTDSTAFKSIF